MLKEEEFLDHIQVLLDSLLKNALQLKEVSSNVVSEEELNTLQEEQESLIAELGQLGSEFKKKFNKIINELKSEKGKIIQKKVKEFQELNAIFYNNISIRKSILQTEIETLRKTQQSIAEIKKSYIKKNNQSGSRRSVINTLS